MIISPFWLRIRWTKDYPDEEFEVMVSNLEPVALRFRFRFVATQVTTSQDCTQALRDHVDPLPNLGTATLLAVHDWSRDGHLYSTRWDVQIGPGETHRTGLASVKPMDVPGMFAPDVFEPGGVLRGHWELSLPMLGAASPPPPPKPQLDDPAHVLIAAFRHAQKFNNGKVTHDAGWALPLASGQAGYWIPPDTLSAQAGGVAATPRVKRRAATKRRR